MPHICEGGAGERETGAMKAEAGLREVLLGAPLGSGRAGGAGGALEAVLRRHVDGLGPLLRVVYGDGVATKHAVAEMARVAALPGGADETVCRRATLLYALHREPEVQRYFARQGGADAAFADDLVRRVLPYVVPRFVKGSFQGPGAFVLACVVLAEMWAGERLGNWPREQAAKSGKQGEQRTTI